MYKSDKNIQIIPLRLQKSAFRCTIMSTNAIAFFFGLEIVEISAASVIFERETSWISFVEIKSKQQDETFALSYSIHT